MQKQGHALRSLDCSLSPSARDALRDQFSITTAEELVSAATHSSDALREHLQLTDEAWQTTLTAARAACSPELIKEAAPQKYAKGAVLKRAGDVRPDLDKFLTRE